MGVENSLHWVLDVTFDEDWSRIKAEHQGEATESRVRSQKGVILIQP